uniref:Uncharacterized protein n=1 Tax=Arundo donax TaxID=35708 RepID=A0A0A8YDQ6_ARUDO
MEIDSGVPDLIYMSTYHQASLKNYQQRFFSRK